MLSFKDYLKAPNPTPVPTPQPPKPVAISQPKPKAPSVGGVSASQLNLPSNIKLNAPKPAPTLSIAGKAPVTSFKTANKIKIAAPPVMPNKPTLIDKAGSYIAKQPLPVPFLSPSIKRPTVGQAANFAKEAFIQAPAQFGAGAFLSSNPGKAITGGATSFTPTTPMEKFVMGDKPVKNLQGQSADASKALNKGVLGVGLPKDVADKVGMPSVLALGALNFVGGGAKNQVAREVSKANTIDDFIRVVAKDKNLAGQVEAIIKDAKNPINSIEELFKVAKGKTPSIGTKVAGSAETKLLGAGDPEQRLVDALSTNKGLRAKQEALYTGERSQRIAKALDAGQAAGGGEAGFYAKKGQLSGKFDVVQNENASLRSQLSQSDIDGLINKIDSSPALTDYEKIPATDALINLMQKGKIPTESELAKLNTVFKPETIKAIIGSRSTMQKIYSTAVDVGNVPRSIMSSFDFSAPLRQGSVLASSHPKEFTKAFKNMFGYAFSEKKFMQRGADILEHPNYLKAKDANLAFTVPGSVTQGEEAFMSNLAEKLPIIGRFIRGSDRAYTGFLNDLRFGTFNSLLKGGEKMGKGDDAKYLSSLGDFVNTATGRGNLANIPLAGKTLEASAPLLNAAFFSPRLIASRVSFFNPVWYAKMDPTVRKEAAKSIVAFVATGMTILGLSQLVGADKAETDPTSADFGKIKTGNTRYDIWGGFQPYATFIARMILNHQKSTTTGGTLQYGKGYKPETRYSVAGRFLQGKLSPNASLAADAMMGQDFERNKFDLTNPDLFVNPLAKRVTPLILSDLKSNIDEYGAFGPLFSIPGLFGVGGQTYRKKSKIPLGTRLMR